MTGPWTTAADLRAQVQRRWDRGELLAVPDGLFPLRLSMRGPDSGALSTRFGEVRAWAAALADSGCRLVMRELRHRVIGRNSLPDEAWVDTLDAALGLIGKRRDARRFKDQADVTRSQQPALLPWLQQQPLRALAVADDWPRLLAVLAWLQAHPRPGLYLRQVDLPGIDSKFIEAQRGLLSELLDLALPAVAIDTEARGAAAFAQRYGFRDKPLRVRWRWLDADQAAAWPGDDVTLTHEAFARLAPAVQQVFITENEVNFLAFPAAPRSLVVFGAGYGFDALAPAAWLQRCRVFYWGDIDTHGFAILDQLRAQLPHAQSLLMDQATFTQHRALWTTEAKPTHRDLTRLTDDERRLYDDLRWRRQGDEALRLEQERLGFSWVQAAVAALVR